ncbi:complement C1q and tumor necrosis factor-related protein 9-like [Littorina saxatilis]|uniref:C1q domain-containing protein n=1 Tax=Littorina saxatilis TaxID=31220 RepID=A0AAN9C1S9_9CAEN
MTMQFQALFLCMSCVVLTSSVGAHAISKRSDDPNPLSAIVQQLSSRITQLEAKQTADDARLATLEHKVGFKATFSVSTLTPSITGPYKFDRVVFNDGNAYNPILGVFTAPYSGVYTFTFQIFTHLAERAIVDIRVNGNVISRMGLDTVNQSVQSDSTSVTAKLVAGDKVWVEAGSANALDIYGPNHTFFYGALLFVS